MNTLAGTSTEKNLMTAFVMESQAIQKYQWFGKIANKEGFQQMEAIFKETATQKVSHCKTLFRFLEGLDVDVQVSLKAEPLETNLANLKAAAKAEREQEKLFAGFEETARAEGFKQAATKLMLFRKIKLFYAERFEKLASNIENDEVFRKKKKVKWMCRKCGLIYEGESALKNCPGCEHPQAYFEELAENY